MSSEFPNQQFNPQQQPFNPQQQVNPQFNPQSFQPSPRKSGFNWLVAFLLIGLGVFMLGGALLIGGVWYVAANFDKWIVGIGREAIVAVINDSELPQEEKKEVITQIDRIVTAYKEGKIDQADLEKALNDLQESPALEALSLYGIEEAYLANSNLNAEEIEEGRRTFQRAIRGVYEGKISGETFFALLGEELEETNQDGQGNLQGQLRPVSTNANNDDELRLALAKLKVTVENAGIPDEPFKLDIGDAVKKLVDKALERK